MSLRTELLRHLGLGTFVVVDLETTGLDPENDEIIEIGAIKFVDGVEAESFDQLVNPGRPIPEFITRLTGISDDDVKDKPSIEEVFPRLDIFLGGAAFVGQQVNFDASFIEYHYRRTNNDFQFWEDKVRRFKYLDNLRLDTLFIARIFLPFLAQFKLEALAKYYGYDLENAHQAIEDARATGHVFLKLVDRALAIDNQVLVNIINLLYPNSKRAKTFFVPVLNFKKEKNIEAAADTLLDDMQNAQQYYNIIGEQDYSYSHEVDDVDLESVDEKVIEDYFGESGPVARGIDKYEARQEQVKMSHLVNSAFNESEFLIAEAGTGTGKSMAYLIPAVEWAVKNRKLGQRVIISTNTKNLQEQLFFKDIPLLFSASKGRFKAVLLKGRANYLCLEKWNTVMTDMNHRLSQDERSKILPLVLWAKQTRTGDVAENAGFQLERNAGLWQKLIAEPSYCPGKSCKFYKQCFLMKVRENARQADIVVVNHSLLFSDLASENSILDEYQNLIIDEAHNIEKNAAEYLGVTANFWAFRNIFHKLYEEEPKRSGTLQQLDIRLSRGQLGELEAKAVSRKIKKVKQDSLALKEKTLIFFNAFSQSLRQRYMNGGPEDNRVRYFKGFKFFKQLDFEIENLQKSLSFLEGNLDELIRVLDDLDDDQFEFQNQLLRELLSISVDIKALQEDFKFCLNADQENYVYWLEISRNEKSNDVRLRGVPLNIAEILKSRLFENLRTVIFSSATLAVSGKMDYFRARTGIDLLAEKTARDAVLGSPFDFEKQLNLGILDFMPDPRDSGFADHLAETIKAIHARHKTGMLVLFTNYSLLNNIYEKLKPHFDAERVLLLAQGKSGSRTNLLNQFKAYRDSILFGTDSFWEGVDVQGEALEILFIPKLPFDVPSDPLIAARMEEIKKKGGNPFFDYSVPEAIIKFRQGFGRLIRSKSDFGAVIVGDNRLSRMQYGRSFLNSLPVEGSIFNNEQDFLSGLGDWFAGREQ